MTRKNMLFIGKKWPGKICYSLERNEQEKYVIHWKEMSRKNMLFIGKKWVGKICYSLERNEQEKYGKTFAGFSNFSIHFLLKNCK